MKSELTTLESNKVKLSVEVDETEIDNHIDEAFKKIAKEVRLPGFRLGKAPRKVLEARIGKDYARGEALREALPEYYRQAIIEHDVDVIAPPDLDITDGEEEGPVAFEAVVEVRPEITIAGYNGLRVEIPAPAASDEEIASQIDSLRDQFAEREEVSRSAIDDDYVTVDITTSHDGEPVEGLTAEDYTYELGSGLVVEEM
ncbi:MAG: trigger factor [Acidimicrobiia bacterium]